MSRDCYYHYTTAQGLIGIVKNQKIWATNIFYLNDVREFVQGVELGEEYIKALINAQTARRTRRKQTSSHLKYLRKLLREVRALRSDPWAPAFVCSLSERPDDLSQWRAYCPTGGFAIGFPGDMLRAIAEENRYSFGKCEYESKQQKREIKAAIRKGINVDKDLGGLFAGWSYAAASLVVGSARLKDPAFESEAEWRMICYPESTGGEMGVDFRAKDGLVIPFTKCALRFKNENARRRKALARWWKSVRVTVGPCPHPTASKASVEKLLSIHGPAKSPGIVTESKVPYRYW